jgi:hypothetical protein
MVATDWGPVVQTAIGAAAALGGGVIGGWLQGRNQDRLERNRRREEAAKVVASTTALLRDADPTGELAYMAHWGAVDDTLTEVQRRQKQLQQSLLVMAASTPSKTVRRLAQDLEVALAASLESTTLAVDSRLGRMDRHQHVASQGAEAWADQANPAHTDASKLLAELYDAIRKA